MLLFSLCTSSAGLRFLLIIKTLLQVICTIIPLIIIYKAFSVSLKNTVDGGKEVKKDLSGLFKSFVAGLVIFLIPIMINYTFTDLIKSDNDFVSCINNASLEGVLEAEVKEQQEEADKKKAEEEENLQISKDMREKRKKEIEETAQKRKEQGNNHNKGDVEELLKQGKWVADYVRVNGFSYGNAPINPAINSDAKIVSCDRLVGWVLYRAGWDEDQPEVGGLTVGMMPEWLNQHGWKRINNINDLQAGDIVFVNPDENGNPKHVFLLGNKKDGNNWERYDGGTDTRIQSVQPFIEPVNNFLFAYRMP